MIKSVNIAIFLSVVRAVSSYNIVQSFESKFLSTYKEADNPDVYLSSTQIIARYGYPAESHTIQSKDGFLLTLHRIPYCKGCNYNETSRQPVFVQHGLLGSSADWLLQGNKSLAFLLSDAGYDVWLGNARGNIYSRGHVKLSPKDQKFWDFSFHEMGTLDLPVIFDFIEKVSNQTGNLTYIGHSMGTTMFFVYASTQNATEKIKMMVALAPVAFMSHVRSPIKYLAPWANDIEWLAKYLGLNEFLPNSKIIKYIADFGCDINTKTEHLCEEIIFLFCGFDKGEFNRDILQSVLSHEPAGTSTKTVVHYAQEIKSGGNFCQFDYGEKENIKRYGNKNPPSYNVTKINIPIYLMSALNDWLAGPKDVQKLADLLPNKIGHYVVPMKEFNHIDFLFGKDDVKLVYKPLIEIINKIKNIQF